MPEPGRLAVWVCAALLTACGGASKTAPTDGGAPPVLEVLDPPGAQIGLHYGGTVALRVRYHAGDPAAAPLGGALVHFSIFGDPAGSTLSEDRALTDDSGTAAVQLSAGAAEATFRIEAMAPGALPAELGISVSQLAFVEVAAGLAGPSGTTTVRALLYDDRDCAALPPAAMPPTPVRALFAPGPNATLRFINLLSRHYALVGRAEDAAGHLLARGCLDLPSALVPPGSMSSLALPLSAVAPSLIGTFALTTDLVLAAPTATAPWHRFGGCAFGAAQMVLDATETHVPMALAGTIEQQRLPAGSDGCRPAGSTLDSQLQSLLTGPGNAPADQLAAIAADLDSIVGAATITSELAVSAGPTGLLGDHLLKTVSFALPAMSSYPLDAEPVVEASGISIDQVGAMVAIGPHGFTLGLGPRWELALDAGSIVPRTAQADTAHLVAAVVAVAVSGGKSGCAGVENLVCTATGAMSCTGVVAPACTSGLDDVTASLRGGFAAPAALDFEISRGTAAAVDTNGDLAADQLSSGAWTTGLASSATFTGLRQP